MNHPVPGNQLSFVMPLSLREQFTDASSWRDEVNKDAEARVRLFLRSFTRLFCQDDLCEFIIVSPDDQCAAVRDIVAAVTRDQRYLVLAESGVTSAMDGVLKANVDGLGGWYAQQIIKLAAHRIVRTSHYFVIDSDLVCIRPCSYASFIVNGRALLNIETAADYGALYSPAFVDKEVGIKTGRRKTSLAILGQDDAGVDCTVFYGETPVILSAPHVAAMLGALENVHGKDWASVLAENQGWTEYGLYFGYLDAMGLTGTVYQQADCDTVLSLRKSVWQETGAYRAARHYNHAHFFGDDRGYFVAIQSWIPSEQWLPPRYDSKLEFYADMEKWQASIKQKPFTTNP